MELQSSSGLQNNNQIDSSSFRGSDALSHLYDRVSSALDKMNSNTAANGGSSGVSVDKVREMFSSLAGAPLPGQNSVV